MKLLQDIGSERHLARRPREAEAISEPDPSEVNCTHLTTFQQEFLS